jgi:hypothetical protein
MNHLFIIAREKVGNIHATDEIGRFITDTLKNCLMMGSYEKLTLV